MRDENCVQSCAAAMIPIGNCLDGCCQQRALVEAMIDIALSDALPLINGRIIPNLLNRSLEKLRTTKMVLLQRNGGSLPATAKARLRAHAPEIGLLSPACVTAQGSYCCGGACVAGKAAPVAQRVPL